ncbi:probable trehalose-phosphate phosphatase 6 isoform X1 [Zingiber officinale]|uniref:probable trehalose-phosphate phosphatase 6 isoform X1 n=1 Tax=Zingiber officinale TaxID=94328 RepID=UPI001C4D0A5E|nr:probable trehalose-phosphate phosphatase 6 isoform X1 [Zingiber officinale]
MTKQSLVMKDDIPVAVVSPEAISEAFPHLSYPPPHSPMAGPSYLKCKKHARRLDLATAGRGNSWIESMIILSPTHVKSSSSSPAGSSSMSAADNVEDYDSWVKTHPSALSNFEEVMATAKGKQVVMFLDYDGTLSPIVLDPDCAFMSDEMREAVREVASHFPTAIVTGRCTEKVASFVKLSELYYAGSHGLDIKGPEEGAYHSKVKAHGVLCQPANEFLPIIDEVYKSLREIVKIIPGSRVENNKFCLSVHFRCVEEKKWSLLADLVKLVIMDYPKLKLSYGRKVLEIRPNIKWDKGKALEFLLESLGFDGHNNVFPLYIGDDCTDEDAFKVLCDREQGFGIIVSKIAKETKASFSLREPAEVLKFLHCLVEWRQLSEEGSEGTQGSATQYAIE